jgi:hypothetical protein
MLKINYRGFKMARRSQRELSSRRAEDVFQLLGKLRASVIGRGGCDCIPGGRPRFILPAEFPERMRGYGVEKTGDVADALRNRLGFGQCQRRITVDQVLVCQHVPGYIHFRSSPTQPPRFRERPPVHLSPLVGAIEAVEYPAQHAEEHVEAKRILRVNQIDEPAKRDLRLIEPLGLDVSPDGGVELLE